MTLAAVIALSNSCSLAENHRHRIAQLVFVQHFDELFVCLLNPVSIVAVNGVDQTVCSPVVLAPSTLNSVLASRHPHGETQVLVFNGLHFATDLHNGSDLSPSFSLQIIVVCSTIRTRLNPANQAIPSLGGNQTNDNQYALTLVKLPLV